MNEFELKIKNYNPPHIRISKLRNGEKVKCLKCNVGVMKPIGDFKTACTFVCDSCKNQLIIN